MLNSKKELPKLVLPSSSHFQIPSLEQHFMDSQAVQLKCSSLISTSSHEKNFWLFRASVFLA